jgi:hypothetical protein
MYYTLYCTANCWGVLVGNGYTVYVCVFVDTWELFPHCLKEAVEFAWAYHMVVTRSRPGSSGWPCTPGSRCAGPLAPAKAKFFWLSLHILVLGPYSWLSPCINDWLSIVFDRLYVHIPGLSVHIRGLCIHVPPLSFPILNYQSIFLDCLPMSVITLWLSVRIPSCLSIFLDCLSTFLDCLSIFLALSQYP